MKVKIEIDTTEQYSTRRNFLELIGMVLEESSLSGDGQTAYKSAGGHAQTCKYSIVIE